MKNTMKCLEAMRSIAIIALVAVIGFSFAACDNGTGGGEPEGDPTSATYTSYDSDGNSYELKITKGTKTHNHTWSDIWLFNATQHWRECIAGDGVTTTPANHSFIGDICRVCNYDRSSGIGGGNSALNGSWVNQAGEIFVLNNGNFTVLIDNVESVRGTYNISGNNLTMTISQIKGSTFGADAAQMGISPNQWYTKSQLRTAVINWAVGQGFSQSQAETLVDTVLEENPLFEPMTGTYSVNGDTLNMDGAVLTRQGSVPGHNHTYSATWSYDTTQHWHACIANDGGTTDLANHTGNPCGVCGYSSSGSSAINGTWIMVDENNEYGAVIKMVFNNGNFIASRDNRESLKGTYSISGSSITIAYTHANSNYMNEFFLLELPPNQWYNRQQMRTAMIKNYPAGMVDNILDGLFEPGEGTTYTLSGNTLVMTIDDHTETFTRQGSRSIGTVRFSRVADVSLSRVAETLSRATAAVSLNRDANVSLSRVADVSLSRAVGGGGTH